MAFEKKTFAPDAIERARRLYEDPQASLDAVAAALGTTRRTLASRIGEWGWPQRGADNKARASSKGRASNKARAASANRRKRRPRKVRKPSKPRAQQPAAAVQAGLPAATPQALARRVQRMVERELDAIDKVLSAIGAADSAEAERSARTLASLARALKEVMRLAAPDETPETDDDDPVPRDLDEFRRELARRIDALAAGAAAAACGDGG
jgi:hypothetical protein